ncbi:hypothetical protein, partial [Candidatus Nitrotoga sp. 1052]|uniref:hypothetical protein n=1 Tax=Candidatus Nitrotoga sp. 1052 TaxID=2886964 RepID=UPI001EF7363E
GGRGADGGGADGAGSDGGATSAGLGGTGGCGGTGGVVMACSDGILLITGITGGGVTVFFTTGSGFGGVG